MQFSSFFFILCAARTCAEWLDRGLTVSTIADLDPDEDGPLEPVQLQCDLDTVPGQAVTIIGTDDIVLEHELEPIVKPMLRF